jgi:hypothetical protein
MKEPGRPIGSRDSKPRKLSERAINNLRPRQPTPGFRSFHARVFAENLIADWWEAMPPKDRGDYLRNSLLAEGKTEGNLPA